MFYILLILKFLILSIQASEKELTENLPEFIDSQVLNCEIISILSNSNEEITIENCSIFVDQQMSNLENYMILNNDAHTDDKTSDNAQSNNTQTSQNIFLEIIPAEQSILTNLSNDVIIFEPEMMYNQDYKLSNKCIADGNNTMSNIPNSPPANVSSSNKTTDGKKTFIKKK